ncbi:MAG: glycoside hydrolase family 15 protein [Lautropia sp.]|nr:glycoside hydrolase family 15 protein [Lautropia sp.]
MTPPESASKREYPPIGDYAAIGDCHGAALVSTDGGIDWGCLGRFDADPIFCRLLDADRGGFMSAAPREKASATRSYLDGTNILRTEFRTSSGRVAITDFMPVGRAPSAGPYDYVTLNAPGWIVRRIEGVEGRVDLHAAYRPSVAFARRCAELKAVPGGIALEGDDAVLRSDLPLRIAGDRAECTFSIGAGECRYIVVGKAAAAATTERVDELFDITCAFWKEWIGYCRYRGPYAAMVRRSALALKLMTYAPTGASVAALTTSLPEEIGAGRNWDYRYCWVRDASLMLQTLASLGYSGEARRFYEFMQKALKGPVDELQIMYGVGMERELHEHELGHLEGYRGSKPVRTGNGAYDQRQSDLYGYLLEGALTYSALGGKISAAEQESYVRVADFITGCWLEPDKGLWEIRGEPQHFVHSKAMCWVVMDRAIRLLGERPGWVALRERIWRDIADHGRSPEGHFIQAYSAPDEAQLDAALVQLAMMGLPADLETLRLTREAVERELRRGDFLLRYTGGDGVEGKEGGFLVCSFWLVDALLYEGRGAEARALFERLLGHANDVGLYAEESDPESGALLGNFPQAFTHLGLVGSAVNLALFEKRGAAALRGSYADRARRSVWATFGWKGVISGLLQSRRINFFSSRKSRLSRL